MMASRKPIEALDRDLQRLVRMARQVRKRAYAPYSKFLVGCAILDASGGLHTGCNVENASYGAGICAERAAIVKMVSRGHRDARYVVVATSAEEPVFPCGVCLQVLQELARSAIIVAVNRRGTLFSQARLSELYPAAFSREQLRG
jgi:cytidine deaminase